MSDLFSIRDYIANNSDNAAELRARWQNDSAQPRKESLPVNTATSNFLSELVSEQVEANERAASAAKFQAEESERTRIKSLNSELKRHFAKLVDKGVGSVEGGEFRFPYNGVNYTVWMCTGSFGIKSDKAHVATFGADGDAVTSLAKVLAKVGR